MTVEFDLEETRARAKELGVSKEQVIEALVTAQRIRKDRFTILGNLGLTYEAAEKVAEITKVI